MRHAQTRTRQDASKPRLNDVRKRGPAAQVMRNRITHPRCQHCTLPLAHLRLSLEEYPPSAYSARGRNPPACQCSKSRGRWMWSGGYCSPHGCHPHCAQLQPCMTRWWPLRCTGTLLQATRQAGHAGASLHPMEPLRSVSAPMSQESQDSAA